MSSTCLCTPATAVALATDRCMEAAGILDGDMMVIEKNRKPRRGDAVIVEVDSKPMVREYVEEFRGAHIVATRYKKPPYEDGKQRLFFAPKLVGVVTSCYREVWNIDNRQYQALAAP